MSDAERKGYVYLIVNDQIRGRIKIGYTMREPIERAYELVSTGTTGTFVVIYQALVWNPKGVEAEVHRQLAAYNCGLEWFEVCPDLAKEVVLSCAGQVLYEDASARWHHSQPEPAAWTMIAMAEARHAAEEREKASRLYAEEVARRQSLIGETNRLHREWSRGYRPGDTVDDRVRWLDEQIIAAEDRDRRRAQAARRAEGRRRTREQVARWCKAHRYLLGGLAIAVLLLAVAYGCRAAAVR